MIRSRKINELIGFLNLNNNYDIENHDADDQDNLSAESEVGKELRIYLKPQLLEKWGVEPTSSKK